MSQQYPLFDLNAEDIVQSDATIYNPPLVCLIISAPGTVSFKNGRGETKSFVVGATATEPFSLWGQITQVLAATTQADADLLGLRVSSVTPTTA